MPISDGFKAIGPAWASANSSDRIAPDDSSLTPPITISDGWPLSFSTAGGDTPRRAVMNELFYRLDSAALDVRNYGILPWDTDVDTLEGGVKQVNGVIYRATVDTGPTHGNSKDPTTSGQTIWETVSGTVGTPNSPNAPTSVESNGQLIWSWNCPLDNGAAITSFDFQWREQGTQSWTRVDDVLTPRYVLTGLTNGTTYEARVRSTNAQGNSGYGSEGTGTPEAAVPGGGNTLAMRASAGDVSGELELSWLQPDNNGAAIQNYRVQWDTNSSFSSPDATTTTNRTHTVTGLTDGTAYYARVRARNSAGNGAWSNTDSAAPETPLDPSPTPPTQRHRFTSSQTWQWPYDDLDRAGVVLFGLNSINRQSSRDIPLSNSNWRGGVSDGTTLWFVTQTDPDTAFAYNASTRARDSSRDITLGDSFWQGGVSDGTTLWFITQTDPDTAFAYNASTRARDSSRDITLGSGTWVGTVSDGTTLWFIDSSNPRTAFAYNASTRTRDSSRDISLASSNWRGGVSDGTTLWFITATNPDTAFAYNASTRARDSSRDITLGDSFWQGGVSDGTTLWFITETDPDTAFAYNAPSLARLVTGGSTYTTANDADGFVSQTLTSISNNQSFAFTITGAGFAEVYPQL